MDGKITEYSPFNKRGKVSGSDGEHEFDASPQLAADLSDTIIPPDAEVDAIYDTAGTGDAINVELAHKVSLAASAEPTAAKTLAMPTAPKKAAKKLAPKKKLIKAPAKKSKKNPASKGAAAKKHPAPKPSKRSAPKRKRR